MAVWSGLVHIGLDTAKTQRYFSESVKTVILLYNKNLKKDNRIKNAYQGINTMVE